MASQYVRVSPGIYRDTKTGKTIKSATDPNKGQAPVSNAPVSAAKKAVPQTDLQKEQAAAANTATQQTQYQNPNQTDAYKNRQDVTYDENGKPTSVNQQFSQANQGIADANSDISQLGRNVARGTLQGIQNGDPNALAPQYSQGDLGADRSRIEGQVYDRLTANTERDYNQQKAQRAQQLSDSGNPPGSPLYEQQMKDLETQHSDARLAASQTAVGMGGDQYTQMFNANQTQRQNQIGNIGIFANQGPGLQGGNFNPFSAGQYQPGTTPFGIKQGNAAIQNNKDAINVAMSKLGRGGGGGSGSTPPPAFG